jgi:hypothetical protein
VQYNKIKEERRKHKRRKKQSKKIKNENCAQIKPAGAARVPSQRMKKTV